MPLRKVGIPIKYGLGSKMVLGGCLSMAFYAFINTMFIQLLKNHKLNIRQTHLVLQWVY